MTLYAEVIVPLPLEKTFYYIVPEDLKEKIKIGSRVLVSFRHRLMTGFIVKLHWKNPAGKYKLKEVKELLDDKPVFTSPFLLYTRKLAAYFYSSWGSLLQASIPPSLTVKSRKRVFFYDKAVEGINMASLSNDEKKILTLLQKKSYIESYLKRKLKIRDLGIYLQRLEKKGLIFRKEEVQRKKRDKDKSNIPAAGQLEIDFSQDKKSIQAAGKLTKSLDKKVFSRFLLYGSAERREGVYFYLIKHCLAIKKRILFLVPEIALTEDLIQKVKRRFTGNTAILHSRLTEKKREQAWKTIKDGAAEVVIGTRSAILSPTENVGLVIIDEEQDDSYYQRQNPAYDARIGARFKAEQEGALLVLGSAFPSVEARFRAGEQGYLINLEKISSPGQVEIVDEGKERRLVSDSLYKQIKSRLARKEQVLAFSGRRGYSAFLTCSRCSYIPRCKNCDISLTYHKKRGELVCHYCNYTIKYMNACLECGSKVVLKKGIGVEVIGEEFKKKFPKNRVAVFHTDEVGNRRRQEDIISRYKDGEIDILVGTSMLAHRLDLPPAFMVVIFYPEITLTLSDYKAAQKTFLSISQMLRHLKKDKDSRAVIKTAMPNNFCIRMAASGDYRAFYEQEIQYRRIMNYPPFSYMAEIVFQDENLRVLAEKSRQFAARVKKNRDIEVLGPALAPVARVRGRNQIQVILKAKGKEEIDSVLKSAFSKSRIKKSVYIYE